VPAQVEPELGTPVGVALRAVERQVPELVVSLEVWEPAVLVRVGLAGV
jgi:hypothetical protein